MAQVLPWLNSNWFSVIQSIGIVGGVAGLWFTARYFCEDTKARHEATVQRKVSNILAFAARHESLWANAYQRDDLNRIFLEQVDLAAHPATLMEMGYLANCAVQYEAGWEIADLTKPEELEPLALDVGEFFSLPLPHFAWEKVKKFRNPKFVRFVERAMKSQAPTA